ncbi:phage holin family protein [Actinacidiphila sp. DG2A-62]|uniref:phage holin family protein n=1 Tax=Actinacidiphila sp. DG2A-62 TaxID=3108821 RepID=UPI002DB7E04E|nr:phage holin family protein [Actinacidiphila sp. DG2A-62]MEC3997941.1 phage holin family protein [Actinacidiphila sp. DG2A-62]
MLAVWAVASATLALLAWVLPDFRIESPDGGSPTQIAVTAAIGAGAFGVLSALVWPLIVRALLLVPALVLGALVFFLNGSLLLIAFRVTPGGPGGVGMATAVVIAAVMSASSSAASTALAVRDDAAYGRRLARLAGRRAQHAGELPPPDGPGTVFLQLDGVGHDVLREALTRRPPTMPTVADWYRDSHRLVEWRTDWSSQTGASQLAILHGSNHDVPAFRWYEKETGQVMVCNRPSSAAELERRAVARTGSPGLLADDGASRGNLFTGGAEQSALVMSVAVRAGTFSRSRSGYFAYFSDPAHAVRTAWSFSAEVCREVAESTAARLRRDRPRVKRGGLYPMLRAFATVVERDVAVAAVIGDMLAGRRVVYADLVAYDEVAHHSGPHSRDARRVLARLDRSVRLIADAARYAPRGYRFVLLSDHGQSAGETFEGAYGLTLRELVRTGCGLADGTAAGAQGRGRGRRPGRGRGSGRRPRGGAEARAAARSALRRPERGRGAEEAECEGPPSEPVVLASGNLGLVSFPDIEGRATLEEISRRSPELLPTLTAHPGIGFVLVRGPHGPLVLGRDGGEHEPATGRVRQPDPLAPFGPGAAAAVLRADAFPHTADLMVNSAVDPATGAVHAFEEQAGSHGGLGGPQSRPFLLHPAELAVGEEPLVGAEALHGLFRGWLARATPDRPAVAADRTVPGRLPGPVAEPVADPVAESVADAGSDLGTDSCAEPDAPDSVPLGESSTAG